jgi:hypothetical protein
MEPPCFFFSLEKESTTAAADAMKESSSSDDESSNWLRRRDLFLGMTEQQRFGESTLLGMDSNSNRKILRTMRGDRKGMRY